MRIHCLVPPRRMLSNRLIERGAVMALRLREGWGVVVETSSFFIVYSPVMNARAEQRAIAAPPRCSGQNRRRRPGPGSARPTDDRAAHVRLLAHCWRP